MGSVSSLISGHSFHSKHCRASQHKLRKPSHLKKLNRYSDGLLRFGFSQDSGHKSGSKSSKNEDFFYIKVSQKPHGPHRPDYTALAGGELGVPAGTSGLDFGTPTPQKLMPFPSQLEAGEKPLPRPTAFKPVLPRSGALLRSSPEAPPLHPPDKGKEQELRPLPCSGGLSDSGRNSMSSLPTHSTSSSYQLEPLVTPMGPISRFGGSAHNILQCAVIQDSNMMSLKAMSFSDGGNKILNPGKAAQKAACVRSPLATDDSTIQELEQKLLEREGELQELQSSFEEKEISSCQAYEEKQRRCKEELEGLKQKCNSKLKQTSQKTQRTQQVLHLQVFQLQQEKQQLREELEKLVKEQNLLETKLRSYEKEKTSFAPALEETQWEVCQKSGEISLLKTTEILSLKAQLKEVRLWLQDRDGKVWGCLELSPPHPLHPFPSHLPLRLLQRRCKAGLLLLVGPQLGLQQVLLLHQFLQLFTELLLLLLQLKHLQVQHLLRPLRFLRRLLQFAVAFLLQPLQLLLAAPLLLLVRLAGADLLLLEARLQLLQLALPLQQLLLQLLDGGIVGGEWRAHAGGFLGGFARVQDLVAAVREGHGLEAHHVAVLDDGALQDVVGRAAEAADGAHGCHQRLQLVAAAGAVRGQAGHGVTAGVGQTPRARQRPQLLLLAFVRGVQRRGLGG
uniref:Leucine zipper tumor suppressor 1 n=1 Tax=Malurus cyaneus samueli TaxID=2593467 RepID=A0A8C5TQN0_9PASS